MWLKHVLLELAVTLIIVVATIPELEWARWIVVAYTVLMLFLKVISVVGGNFLKSTRPTNPNVPAWFWHVNYAVNIALLASDRWWWMAASWILIWALSVIFERYVNPTIRR